MKRAPQVRACWCCGRNSDLGQVARHQHGAGWERCCIGCPKGAAVLTAGVLTCPQPEQRGQRGRLSGGDRTAMTIARGSMSVGTAPLASRGDADGGVSPVAHPPPKPGVGPCQLHAAGQYQGDRGQKDARGHLV